MEMQMCNDSMTDINTIENVKRRQMQSERIKKNQEWLILWKKKLGGDIRIKVGWKVKGEFPHPL